MNDGLKIEIRKKYLDSNDLHNFFFKKSFYGSIKRLLRKI